MENSFMVFHDVQKEYERNNRDKNMKALRCFPLCRETGHCKSGFCGRALKCSLEVRIGPGSPPCQLDDEFWRSVKFIAELRESEVPSLSSVRFVERSRIDDDIRTKKEKFKTFIDGKIIQIKTSQGDERQGGCTSCRRRSVIKNIDLEFNTQHQAWHYGWLSHKYRNNTKHCVDVLVLIESGSEEYFVAASYMSPDFEIVSTKTVQKKVGQADEAPVAEENNSPRKENNSKRNKEKKRKKRKN